MTERRTLIQLRGVGKSYPLVSTGMDRLRTLTRIVLGKPYEKKFDALTSIDFEVVAGESLGLIGVNGAGKSTLLKIIAGVCKATTGSVKVDGRISALLELGAGFHPEYTGRQNIYLSSALLGLSEESTSKLIDSIVAFADIGNHIDQPIKLYSSGMVVRLGFAVATALKPDVLITDEVLAVGDESFQRKCISWIEQYLSDGGTLLLCAHSMFHIQKLCKKAVWIHDGAVRCYGSSHDVTREYLAWSEKRDAPVAAKGTVKGGGALYAVVEMSINGVDAGRCEVAMGESFSVRGVLFSPDKRPPTVAVGIVKSDGVPVYGLSSDMDDYVLEEESPHYFVFELKFSDPILLPGVYEIRAHAMDPEGFRMYDEMNRQLVVGGETREMGVCRLNHSWNSSESGGARRPSDRKASVG